jgi:hypothetical protein
MYERDSEAPTCSLRQSPLKLLMLGTFGGASGHLIDVSCPRSALQLQHSEATVGLSGNCL